MHHIKLGRPGLRVIGQMMLDHLSLNDIDDVFGNVGGMVGNAFKVTGHQDHVHRAGDLLGVLRYMREHVLEDLMIERVHFVVAQAHIFSQRHIIGCAASPRGNFGSSAILPSGKNRYRAH